MYESVALSLRNNVNPKEIELISQTPPPAKGSATRTLDINETMRLIVLGHSQVEKAEGQNIVLFLGPTGSGKSTAINYLAGCTMLEIDDPMTGDFSIKTENPVVDIGDGALSTTLYPSIVDLLVPSGDKNIKFCDTAGFGDNRGPEYDICAAYTLGSVFEKAKAVQGVAVLIQLSDITDPRLPKLIDTFRQLNRLFTNRDNYTGSILLLVTKADFGRPRTVKQIYNILSIRLKELKKPQAGTQAKVDISDIEWLFDEVLKEEGKAIKICRPLAADERPDLIETLQTLKPVRDPGSSFKYPISTSSQLELLKLISDRKTQLIDQMNTLSKALKSYWLNYSEEHSHTLVTLENITVGIQTLKERLTSFRTQQTSVETFVDAFEVRNEAVKLAANAIKDNLSVINNLNHFFGKDEDQPRIPLATVDNYIADANELNNKVATYKNPLYGNEMRVLLESRAIQTKVWGVREKLRGLLEVQRDRLTEDDCQPIWSHLTLESRVQFKELLSLMNQSGNLGCQNVIDLVRQTVLNPFTMPTEAIEGQLIIKSNVANIALSQIVQYLTPMKGNLNFHDLVLQSHDTLLVDDSLKAVFVAGKNVVITTNNMEILTEDCKINTSGNKLLAREVPSGEAGRAGNSAGNIYLNVSDKMSGYTLSLIANGSSGEKGGNGNCGKTGKEGDNGKDADAPGAPGSIITIFEHHDEKISGSKGEQGGKGGQGSNAGRGGPAGFSGLIEVMPKELSCLSLTHNNGDAGTDGTPGSGGNGGKGGENGYDILWIKPGTQFSTSWYKGYIDSFSYDNKLFTQTIDVKGRYTSKSGGDTPPANGPTRERTSSGPKGDKGIVANNAVAQNPRITPLKTS
jgi:energy-coupling factor transporter ATP-binding protein EcfA2